MSKAQSSGRAAWIWTGLLAVCLSLAVGGIAVRAFEGCGCVQPRYHRGRR